MFPDMEEPILSPDGARSLKKGDTVMIEESVFFTEGGHYKYAGDRLLQCRLAEDLNEDKYARLEVVRSEGANPLPRGAVLQRHVRAIARAIPAKGGSNGSYKSGGHLEGVANGEKIELDTAKKGGMSVGAKHTENGIKGAVGTEGRPIEFEGEEIILTAPVASDPRQYDFNGKKLTAREIASQLNVANGGVSFEKGGDVKSCMCSGKRYSFGGSTKTDRDIIKFLNEECGCDHSNPHYRVLSELNAGDITIKEALKLMAEKN